MFIKGYMIFLENKFLILIYGAFYKTLKPIANDMKNSFIPGVSVDENDKVSRRKRKYVSHRWK